MASFFYATSPQKYAIATHILVSDRNFFLNERVWRYLLDQAHMLVKGICC